MNKKGFTLIELLMVIAIIAIISMILIPNVINMISTNKQKSCESLKKNIISATKLYVNENKYDLGFTCDNTIEIPISNTIKISISKLIEAGKIDGDIKNPINNDDLTNKEVSVTFNCQTKQFTYDFNYKCE
jgi:prepilin-type N-terminal cleavage/methylation domain-containing protein